MTTFNFLLRNIEGYFIQTRQGQEKLSADIVDKIIIMMVRIAYQGQQAGNNIIKAKNETDN